jgi:thioredoxin 1
MPRRTAGTPRALKRNTTPRENQTMSINILSESNFVSIIGAKPALIDFNATWCGPCRKIAPIIEEIANENPDLFVGSVDVDLQPNLAARFGVRSIPTVVLLKNGEVVKQFIGAQTKETYLKAIAEL